LAAEADGASGPSPPEKAEAVSEPPTDRTLQTSPAQPAERFGLSWPGKAAAAALVEMPCDRELVLLERLAGGPTQPSTRPITPEELASGHLYVEGENLDVLKLLGRTHSGRVKMIYIDPPYNTGLRRSYRDNFALPRAEYLRQNGRRGAPTDLLGRRHAAWLSMMYPRLILARGLLRDDGAIFVSIDDHEVAHLRLLLDEVFGEENFRNAIVVGRGVKSVQAQFPRVRRLTVGHEYILFYSRTAETRFPKHTVPRGRLRAGTWNSHWRGTDRPSLRYQLLGVTPTRGQWRWTRERSLRAVENYERLVANLGRGNVDPTSEEIEAWRIREERRTGTSVDLLRRSARGQPEHYVPPTSERLGSDLWTDQTAGGRTADVVGGRAAIEHPKSPALIRRMLTIATDAREGDVVLDFFAGSGATGEGVLEQNVADGGNRRFIMVQSGESPFAARILSPGAPADPARVVRVARLV
jgi:adenine-specific DNA-methyltransferase